MVTPQDVFRELQNNPHLIGDDEEARNKSSVVDNQISEESAPGTTQYVWKALGSGSYNKVWQSNFSSPEPLVSEEQYPGPWVLKYAIPSTTDPVSNAMNNKDRAIRIWNEINHDLPKAGPYKLGWVAPFIKNTRQATDDEIARKLVDIFCQQRRIVIDAATKGNFLTKLDTGEVILVDVDLALKRRGSVSSRRFAETLNERFASYWVEPSLKNTMPLTLLLTRNLLFLEDQLTENEITSLIDINLINLENIEALTWLRVNKQPLSFTVFKEIATLTESGVFTDELLSALMLTSSTRPNTSSNYPERKPDRYTFFQGSSAYRFESQEQELDTNIKKGCCYENGENAAGVARTRS